MNKEINKTKEQLLTELLALRKNSKAQDAKIELLQKEFEAKVSQTTQELEKCNHHYKMLFNESPIPTWEEDFSLCKIYIDSLKERQITNFRAYFEEHPDEVIKAGNKVKIIDVNKGTIHLHEAQSKEELLEILSSILSDKSYETVKEQLICIAEGKNEFESEGVVKTIAGKEKNILLKWVVVPGYEGTYGKVYVTTIDITERKQADNRLKANEDRLFKTLMAANVGYWDWDLKTNNVFFDALYYQIAGYEVDEFPHRFEEFQKRIHPEEVDDVMDIARKHLEGQSDCFMVEFRFKKKSGDWLWIQGRGQIVEWDEKGVPKRFIGTHSDISSRKQVEEKEKEQQRNIELIYATAMELVEFPKNENIYNYIGEQIRNFVGENSFVIVNSVDEEAHSSTVQTVLGMGKYSHHILKLLGKEPLGLTLHLNDTSSYYADGKMHVYNEGLYGLLLKTVSKFLCESVEKVLKIKKIHIIDLSRQGHFFGSVIILTKENTDEFKHQRVIETFIKQASIVIQKRQAEEKLYASNQQLIASEKALKESESLKEKLLNTSPDIIYIYDLVNKRNIYSNESVFSILGYSVDEVQAMGERLILDLMHPDDLKTYVQDILPRYQKLRDNEFLEHEYRMKHKDGSWLWLKSRESIYLRSENGEALQIFGIITDVTERKQADQRLQAANQHLFASNQQLQSTEQQLRASNQELMASEEALKESELKLQKIINESFEGISVTNEKGQIIVWNKALEAITGIKQTETIDQYIWDVQTALIDHDGKNTKRRNEIKSELLDILKTGEAPWLNKVMERDYIDPDGMVKTVSAIMYTIKTQKGYLLVSVSNDITASKLAQEQLKESEERYRLMLNTSLDGVILSDEKGKIIQVNPSYCNLIGYNEQELLSMNINNIEAQQNEQEIEERIQQMISVGKARFETRHRAKDGHLIDLEVGVSNLKNEDKTLGVAFLRDITERKQAEEALKEAQSNLQALLDNRADSIWALDRNYNFLVFNKPYADVIYSNMGVRLEKGMNALEIHPQEVNDFWKPKFDDVFNGNYVTFEFPFTMDGKEHFFEVFMNPIYTDNQVRGLSALSMDITQRKRAENKLMKLSAAVTQSPSVIIITDPEGQLEYVNPTFTAITGYSIEEVKGKNPRILKSGEQSDEVYKELWETICQGNAWRGEFHNKKKNGDLFWETASVSPIFDEQGKIINYIKVAEDITVRRQAEENFKHSIDESPLGIRIVDQTGKTIYVNKALLDIYEYTSPDEFYNTKAKERYTAQSYQEHQERKKIRKEGGRVSNYEISIRRKNGEVRYIQVWRKEVIWSGEKHFQVIKQDITELKRLNHDLIIAKEKAEESDRLKSAFLANMSHEIRTPMNGILGFTQLLKIPHLTGEKKEQYIQIIEKSGQRMLNTINDIIDISKIESGQVEVLNAEMSVGEVLEEQYNFFQMEAKSKGLDFIYQPLSSDSGLRMISDQHKIEGVLTNLIKNALKYTEEGSITLGCCTKTRGEKTMVEFFVKDTGIGIPEDRVEAIFNRFEQADIEDVRAFQGSGLGLAISKSYVEMLGGEIGVVSKEGVGSTFTFSLPYHKPDLPVSSPESYPEEAELIALKGLSLIVAEDDDTSRMFLETLLEDYFKRIRYASTGKETLELFRENPDTDLILMDIKMPEMNGLEATREIRKFNRDVLIIAQTAYGLAGDKEETLAAGCDDYISKPIEKEVLFEKIRACWGAKHK